MSGPKVVRVVTREELEAICRRQLALVRSAAAELTRALQSSGLLTDAIESDIRLRISSLESQAQAGNFAVVQAQAPSLVLFLRAETKRYRDIAISQAAAAHAERQQLLDSAASVSSALKRGGLLVPQELSEMVRTGSRKKLDELRAMRPVVDDAFRSLIKSQPQKGPVASQGMAERLGRGVSQESLAQWLAARAPSDDRSARLSKLLAEIEVLGDPALLDEARQRTARIDQEERDERRRLLTDSLLLDVSATVRNLKENDQLRERVTDMDAELSTLTSKEAAALRSRLSALGAAGSGADALLAECRAFIDKASRDAASASRRRAVLLGLAGLGYEVREGMETAWAEEGRLVVAKPGVTDYGVELAGPPDASRLQMRVVGAELPASPRSRERDTEQETIWCGDVTELLDSVARAGTAITIERALPVGAQPLGTTRAIGRSAHETSVDVRALKSRSIT
jgi:hypothetical protein